MILNWILILPYVKDNGIHRHSILHSRGGKLWTRGPGLWNRYGPGWVQTGSQIFLGRVQPGPSIDVYYMVNW